MGKVNVEGGKKVLMDQMKDISEKYKLGRDDLFIKESKAGQFLYIIINRAGIDKLEQNIMDTGAFVMWEPLKLEESYVYLRFKIFAPSESVPKVDTTGEASVANVDGQNKYILAMAEKRGRSRAVLKYLGLYDIVKGEDESSEFERDGKRVERTIIKGE
jgi:hypothetical protein